MLARLFIGLINAQAGWARPFGDFNNRWVSALFRPMRPVKDFLNGKWLGHPVHGALTDLPVGIFTLAIVFDLLDLREAADISVWLGILGMLGAAVAGLADYSDTDGHPRMVATVHATIMVVALLVYLVSAVMRLGAPADRTVPIVVGIVAYLLLTTGAYIGGELVYSLGNMVSRHAWRFWAQPKSQGVVVVDVPEGE